MKSFLVSKPFGASSPQHIQRGISVHQFTAFGLRKAGFDLGGNGGALFEHPVFELGLFTDYFERLVQDFVRALIGT